MIEAIAKKEDIVNNIVEVTSYSKQEVDMICSEFIKQMMFVFIKNQNLQLGENLPIFKTKISSAKLNTGSPRTPRNDRVLVMMKIPVFRKIENNE